MFTSLSLLLLLLFSLGFWIVKSSTVSVWIKIASISLFCAFCVFMATTMDGSMGWAAIGKLGDNIPEKITIRHVVIREPNEQLRFNGSIYLLLDMNENTGDKSILRMFSHKPEGIEPRLFRLPYNRILHEELQKFVIPRLLKGQTFHGSLKKGNGEGVAGVGEEGRGSGRQGNHSGRRGYDDRDTEMHIYELPPSEYMPKE